jgi:hypothetical protein
MHRVQAWLELFTQAHAVSQPHQPPNNSSTVPQNFSTLTVDYNFQGSIIDDNRGKDR